MLYRNVKHKNGLLGKAKVIDLFCGIGGMTQGFVKEGFKVIAGIDIDSTCQYGYEKNNNALFIEKDINQVNSEDIINLYGETKIKILIGCAPCQPFSALNIKRTTYTEHSEKWGALHKFAELIDKVKPQVVSMENVKDLANETKYPIFKKFLSTLYRNGYKVNFSIVDTSLYGVPQKRKRLVLLASLLGEIKLLPTTHSKDSLITVRDVISDLPPIEDGETYKHDILHTSSKLNTINKKRILATPHDGGSATDWDESLLPNCYMKKSGDTYMCTVYGRMRWDEPAPTMTTHCISLGTGRYGHPEQNRAISLREAARFQTFPDNYVFMDKNNFSKTTIAKHIGNAVPVRLGQIIAASIRTHLQQYVNSVGN